MIKKQTVIDTTVVLLFLVFAGFLFWLERSNIPDTPPPQYNHSVTVTRTGAVYTGEVSEWFTMWEVRSVDGSVTYISKRESVIIK